MANYDTPGLTYDSGVFFDAVLPPQPVRTKMAEIKLNFKGLSDLGIIQQCTNIKTALTGNAAFTTPTPTLAAFTTLITTAQTKLTAADAAQQAAKLATADKDAAITALLAGVKQLANYVSMTANGDGLKIQSAGFSLKSTANPVGEMPAPGNLSATGGDLEGECDLHWNPVNGRTNYLGEHRTTPSGPWNPFYGGKKSSATATGLVSGTQYDFRVRAVGAAGPGAWSDLAQSRAT
ncbi:MAG: hypothetical protein RL616_2534 [Verrucomicrobiota bacterium]|jgi:hypothetical protein